METRKKHSKFQRYVLPGLIFQSVVIAGGYGTGAEIAQYFFPYGPLGGLLAMCLVTFLFWAVVSAITFEFARVFRTYDYRSLMKGLLGKAWWLFEICYIVLLLIVLAVVCAAAGIQVNALLGISKWFGIIALAAGVAYLVLKGTAAIEKFLSYWSYLLYAVYMLFLVITFVKFGGNIGSNMVVAENSGSWLFGGATYAFYNLACIPIALFATRDAENTKEAVGSGLLAGAIGILPAILLFLAMSAFYPEIASSEVPVNVVFDALNMPWLRTIFTVVLFGTLVETGSGFIKAVTDRLEGTFKDGNKESPNWLRPVVTFTCIILGVCVSTFGLTGLIAKGYGTITWGFFVLYVIPVLTVGVYKLAKAKKDPEYALKAAHK
ncbi:MAG: hypothetical protein EOM54_00950 [Clostridia bacterium]|nr:hypothetical protein [Clostridia bacterium]